MKGPDPTGGAPERVPCRDLIAPTKFRAFARNRRSYPLLFAQLLLGPVEDGEVLEDDPKDPMRTAIRQMRGVFAQLDKTITVKKMRDGRKAKAVTGRKAVGAYAYGFAGAGRDRSETLHPMTLNKP